MIPFSILKRLTCDHSVRLDVSTDRTLKRRLALEQEIKHKLSVRKRWKFELLCKYMVRYIAFRELQRFYLDMILSKIRELMKTLSHRMVDEGVIENSDDIFFLELINVQEYLAGKHNNNLKKRSEFNKISFEDNEVTPGRYLRQGLDFDSIIRSKPGAVCIRTANSSKRRVIKGQAVSAGKRSGKVRVIDHVDSNASIEHNEIVVTKCIDPGQTHVFLLAGALVFEVGGILSHGAILAREFDLPTVASVQNATKIFKTGQVITVDGTAGLIMVGSG